MFKPLPQQFQFLAKEPAPKMLLEALKWHGLKEELGAVDNPQIMEWAKELKLTQYVNDSVPWCGLFIAIIAKRANKSLPPNPLWARDWLTWGQIVYTPKLGDVMIFERKGGGGHVTLYVGENSTHYFCLGGNQGDSVSITSVAKNRLIGIRHLYIKAQPANCRPIYIDWNPNESTNEQ